MTTVFERGYLRLQPVQIVREMLAAERQKLASLAPYNGTVPGARAISESRARVEALEENLAWRAAVNAPDQED